MSRDPVWRQEKNEYLRAWRRERKRTDPEYRESANAYLRRWRRHIWHAPGEAARARAAKMREERTRNASRYRAVRKHLGPLAEKQNGKCPLCGLLLGESACVDHVVPIAKGGTDEPENLQAVHRLCNLMKGPRSGLSDYQRAWAREELGR